MPSSRLDHMTMLTAPHPLAAEDGGKQKSRMPVSLGSLQVMIICLAAAASAGVGIAIWLGTTYLGNADPRDWFHVFFVIFARDEPAGLALVFAFTAAALLWVRRGTPPISWAAASPSRRLISLLALGTFAITAIGTWVVFRQYALTPDENMSDFQARIFLTGQIHQEIPEFWVPLVRFFIPNQATYLPATHSWMSGYLPVYAAFRAVFMSVGLQWFTNPFFAAISIFAIAAVARKIWPDDPWKPVLAAGLLAASPQFLVMSMTSYAMPAHLALNLVWLWLYCDPSKRRFWLAPFVGVLAVGLHQPFVHAAFATPFLLRLVLDRRWKASLWFGVIYLIGIACWYGWWHHFDPVNMAGASNAFGLHGRTFLVQAMYLSLLLGWLAFPIPLLALLGFSAFRKAPPLLRDLAASCVLTFGFYVFVRADQGHGWGDRYFYGALGCLVLAAVAGWGSLAAKIGKPAAASFAVVGIAAALLVQLPLRGFQAEEFARPSVAAAAFFRASNADVIAFDPRLAWYSNDLKRSDPLWREGPIIVSLFPMSEDQVAAVQEKHPAGRMITQEELAAFGLTTERFR